MKSFSLSIPFLALLLLSGTSVATQRFLESLEEAYENCPTGDVFYNSTGDCQVCRDVIRGPSNPQDTSSPYSLNQPDQEQCYSQTNCIKDPFTQEAKCSCEFPLTLTRNGDDNCGFCTKGSDCSEQEKCLKLGLGENICAFPCETNADCVSYNNYYPGMKCKRPYFLESARDDPGSICGCSASQDLIRGFGCVDKQNLTTDPLMCYQCSGAEECARAPFTSGVKCKSNEACAMRAVIHNWTPRSYDKYDHVYFKMDEHLQISRSCIPVTSESELVRTGFLNGEKSRWQNCKIVGPTKHGDESKTRIECESSCIYRYCNWPTVDPIVIFYEKTDDTDIFALIVGILFLAILFGCLFAALYRHKQLLDANKSDDQQALVDDRADYGSTQSSSPDPAPEPEPEPEPVAPMKEEKPEKKKSKFVTETQDVSFKASSRINTGIKKRPPSEVKLGTTTTKKVVDDDDEN